MRTSLNEIKHLEDWLLNQGDLSGRLITEARILTNPKLEEDATWQSATYELVHQYGREKLILEIQGVEKELFTLPRYRSFQDRIRSIFKH